jgi:thiamine biosynthesis protein ThiS
MRITINGEPYEFQQALSVQQLLVELQLEPEKIAIERNMEIVPCSQFKQTQIQEHDTLEIVHFIGGG